MTVLRSEVQVSHERADGSLTCGVDAEAAVPYIRDRPVRMIEPTVIQ